MTPSDEPRYTRGSIEDAKVDIYTYEFKGMDSGQTVEYYIIAENEEGNTGQQPYTGALDPHRFTIK